MTNPVIQEIFATNQSAQPLETTAKFRSRLSRWLVASIALHLLLVTGMWLAPLFAFALGLRAVEIVDEDFNQAILIDFSKKRLQYPSGYQVFRAPAQPLDPKKLKAEEERRERELERARRAAEKRRVEQAEAAAKAGEAKAKTENQNQASAKTEATPTPSPTPKNAPLGKINTRPIREQIQRLYEAKKAGKLVFNENRLKIGVAGRIMPDGSLAEYKVIHPSGNPEVDRAALAILDAVSESRAIGPFYQLSSISLFLEIDERAELRLVGFASDEQTAQSLAFAARLMIQAAISRNEDPTAKDLLNTLKVSNTGTRIQAIASLPRQVAADSLARTMEKP
jgi:hypothetical protein